MSQTQIGLLTYVKSTIGLIKNHGNFNGPKLCRVQIYKSECDQYRHLVAVNGCNLSPLPVPTKTITKEEWVDSPDDPYDDSVESLWCMEMLDLY